MFHIRSFHKETGYQRIYRSSDCHFLFELENGELYPDIESTTPEEKDYLLKKWREEFLASVVEVDQMRLMPKFPSKSHLESQAKLKVKLEELKPELEALGLKSVI